MTISLKQRFIIKGAKAMIGTFFFSAIYLSSNAQIGVPSNKIEQSTFYDAYALYYAFKGISTIPVKITETELAKINEDNGSDHKQAYKLVESLTGKIVKDKVFELKPENFIFDAAACEKIKVSILRRYTGLNADADWDKIKAALAYNTYLKPFLVKPDSAKAMVSFLSMASPDITTKGGISASTLLEGLTEFYIDQVNNEINDAFFIQLKKVLNKYVEIRILFPETEKTLGSIEAIRIQSSLNTLKIAFEVDLKNLSGNIVGLSQLSKYINLINKHNELSLLFLGLDLSHQISKEKNAAEIMQLIGNAPYIQQTKPNAYTTAIKLAAITSYSFRDIRTGDEKKEAQGWVTVDQVEALQKEQDFYTIFLGLFAESVKDINIGGSNLRTLLFNKSSEAIKGKYLVYSFIDARKKITPMVTALTNAQTLVADKIKYSLDLTEMLLSLSKVATDILPSSAVEDINKRLKKVKDEFIPVARQTAELANAIKIKEYSTAISKGGIILNKFFNNWKVELMKLDTLAKTKVDHELRKQLADLKDSLSKNELVERYYQKYGLFIATVAEAKDSKDVKEAIKAFALPTGSSRIKKETRSSFGINGYVGFYQARNYYFHDSGLPKFERGLTAPLGFAYNRGRVLGGSLSLYAGVLDIGAIFSYKVNNDTIKSSVNFAQVLSPSVGLIYGLPVIDKFNIPLSFGANMQWGPKLKKVTAAGNSTLPLMTRRLNIFIAVDLPIVNFYTSKR
ncbi:MAG: hypothetical protein REI78_05960 [Pedobacter sp.]|nr:hypothetical protein [Pedobacter sp.]MDQ8052548.1 hypothetical protein [Pedobacter sp.]